MAEKINFNNEIEPCNPQRVNVLCSVDGKEFGNSNLEGMIEKSPTVVGVEKRISGVSFSITENGLLHIEEVEE